MINLLRGTVRGLVVLGVCATLASAADNKKEFHYTLGPHSSVAVINQFGPVVVKPSAGNQVDITAVTHSDKVEVDPTQNGNRLELRTHFLQNASPEQGRVDFEVHVPADASVNLRSASGPLTVEGLHADVILEGDTAQVRASKINDAHVHVRTLSGPVTLDDITNGHVEVTSVSGPVTLNNVAGSMVAVNTTSGKITYNGDFGGGGDYSLSNHSADIDVTIPTNASVDISARSLAGSVENDFPFQQKLHIPFPATQGKSFAGTSNSGSSSVRLRSFSGKIRLKKK